VQVSYEIGADVFSLTEIEYCVIRGRLARPRSVPRHLPSPPPLEDDHYRYAQRFVCSSRSLCMHP
jgi:hypothetical protein